MISSRFFKRIVFCLCCTAAVALVTEACGPDITFRAYLARNFWRPAWRYVGEMTRGLPGENTTFVPYAGMSPEKGGALARARTAYRDLFPNYTSFNRGIGPLNWPDATITELRELIRNTSPSNSDEAHELELLRCKVELRALKDGSDAALPQVRACFDKYLSQPRPAALASEARGWIARVDFLSSKGSSASRYYMEELASPVSNIARERLLLSLLMIQPTADDLEGYFDTPAHALFAVNQITSLKSSTGVEPAMITALEKHADLFKKGAGSDQLALALMRASLSLGGPAATLRYSEQLPKDAALRKSAEYNWLVGAARYQEKDYAGAEAPLRVVLTAADTDSRLKVFAANALIGVYEKLNRPVDELWAAFQASSPDSAPDNREQRMPINTDYSYELWSTGLVGINFNTAYLLDAQMTDAQLETYLKRFREPNVAVRYALAVRHARHEDYTGALKVFEELHSTERADKMRTAAALFAETKARDKTSQQKLEALYNYADFLAQNEDHIFFNDSLWEGFQRGAFIKPDFDQPQNWSAERWKSLTPEEIAKYEQLDRQLRDNQEEYWRAYKILNQLVSQAGRTELGRKAAELAIVCLRRIRTDRFGRQEEIKAADLRLSRWLAQGMSK